LKGLRSGEGKGGYHDIRAVRTTVEVTLSKEMASSYLR
jgi:hypothetical protein